MKDYSEQMKDYLDQKVAIGQCLCEHYGHCELDRMECPYNDCLADQVATNVMGKHLNTTKYKSMASMLHKMYKEEVERREAAEAEVTRLRKIISDIKSYTDKYAVELRI